MSSGDKHSTVESKVSGFFPARDGTSIYYEVAGEGPPLLFAYGLMCQREHWRHQLAHFRKKYKIIQFDYRGHQCSAFPANDQHMTIQWCAQDVRDLLDYLKVGDVVVLGHSMGVPVLVEAASPKMEAEGSGRIKGLVLVCGCVTNPFARMFFTNRMDAVFRRFSQAYEAAPKTTSALWKRFTGQSTLNYFLTAYLGFNPIRADERDVRMYMQGVMETPVAVFHSLLKDCVNYDGRETLKQLQTPTLVISGERDFITPGDMQEEMVRLLSKGRLHVVEDGSHNAHMDDPTAVNLAIQRFLKELEHQ